MPIRAPWTWLGETPLFGMPRSAPGGMGPDSPIPPAATGSLPASSPLAGKASSAPTSDVSKPPRRLAGRSGARGALDPSRCAQPRAASMISAT